MKLSSYCPHDLEMIIFYRGPARLIFTRVIALWQFFNSKSCLCNSSCSFMWILVKLSSYCSHDLKRITLDCFLPEYGPLSVLAIFNRSFCLRNSYISKGILMELSCYRFHDLKMIIFYRGHAQLIFTRVTVLWQFFNSKSCFCNSSCNFQWILVKPSNYCCHDLKKIISYRGHAWLRFTRVMVLCQF